MGRASKRDSRQPDGLDLGGLKPPVEPEGLSLDQLQSAFAELLARGNDPYQEPPAEAAVPLRTAEELEDTVETSPLSILEALLFVGSPDNRPLSAREVASWMRGVRPAEIDQLASELNARYAADQCPYEIVGEGDGYRLVLRNQYERLRDTFHGQSRQATLSQAAIEVLSIVAYDQPVTAEQVGRRRGKTSGAILSQLVGRQLLRIERNDTAAAGCYVTTDRFLHFFGLGSLADLPRSQDLEKP